MGLIVKGLSFGYGDREILKGIGFGVEEGEVLTLLGPNGSGKTTLIRCINRLLSAESGEIRMDGIDILGLDRREVSKIFAYLPQSSDRGFSYRVMDIVVMGRTPYLGYFSSPDKADYERAEKVLEGLRLSHLANRFFNQLSGGERQIVYLARALIQDAKVLLLDEPTAHLDFKNQLMVIERIKRMVKEKNLIAVIALHDPNQVFWMGDKVLILNRGEVAGYGRPDEVICPEMIKRIYGVSVKVISIDNRKGIIPE